ncbi:MAG TPA: sensor domain-containing diguanylate cyclase [Candidatus Polarisedimenticolia bacterium]|nr:sensor domain-containing diguanylate cyclase [Candidatus Polarisedimenticolia bacterium]
MIAPADRASPRVLVDAARRRDLSRLQNDPHILVAVGIVGASLAAGIVGHTRAMPVVVGAGLALFVVQVMLSPRSEGLRGRSVRDTLRLAAALAFVAIANAVLGPPGQWPVPALFVPIVALAAAIGQREAVWTTGLATALTAIPLIVIPQGHDPLTVERAIGLFTAAGLMIVGTRRTVTALESALAHARRLIAEDRRRRAHLTAVDEVSRLLARSGPTPEVLDEIMGLFERRLGYQYVSIYLGSDKLVRLGAQVGYNNPIHEIDDSRGVTGRTMRTHELQFIRDTSTDADYWSAESTIASEICAPLMAGETFLGTINVESNSLLDNADVATVRLVADRVAAALALAQERAALADRAETFRKLIGFASSVTATLDVDAVHSSVVDGVRGLVSAEIVTLTTLELATGRYAVRAASGLDPKFLGTEIQVGEGLAGRAIRDRAIVVDDNWERSRFPKAALARMKADEELPAALAGVAVPLLRDNVVIGALTIVRPVGQPFDIDEREVLQLVASQAALAVSNASLLAQVTESSLRDPLTGLYNRRFLDATLERMDAARTRLEVVDRQPVSAILFDLDHFGDLNKRHGHQVGDVVLRGFAEILRGRARAADIVARYGGEEFVILLEGASRSQTVTVAEAIREKFASKRFEGAGEKIAVTVSAGCATTDDGSETLSELLRIADAGLAMAKRGGRDQVVAV